MKLVERIMGRLGWVPVGFFEASQKKAVFWLQQYLEVRETWFEERKKLKGIAALTPEQRSARTAKGNRTRALRRNSVNSDA